MKQWNSTLNWQKKNLYYFIQYIKFSAKFIHYSKMQNSQFHQLCLQKLTWAVNEPLVSNLFYTFRAIIENKITDMRMNYFLLISLTNKWKHLTLSLWYTHYQALTSLNESRVKSNSIDAYETLRWLTSDGKRWESKQNLTTKENQQIGYLSTPISL